jgi:hypothetical protein
MLAVAVAERTETVLLELLVLVAVLAEELHLVETLELQTLEVAVAVLLVLLHLLVVALMLGATVVQV